LTKAGPPCRGAGAHEEEDAEKIQEEKAPVEAKEERSEFEVKRDSLPKCD